MEKYVDKYYEAKKARGLIFTEHNLNKEKGYNICPQPDGISWWSKDLGRYRTEEEQKEFVTKMMRIGRVSIGK